MKVITPTDELVYIKRLLLKEWEECDRKHRSSGDEWYAGVLSGIEVAINKVDIAMEHETR
jgi:hypothetical protein